jgi:DNA-binding response OmpR family regulator
MDGAVSWLLEQEHTEIFQPMNATLLAVSDDQIAVAPTAVRISVRTDPPPRILLVEDDEAMRQFYARMLVRDGHWVGTAEDGAAGWEALQGSRYDLLITDNNMPKMTGLEMVTKLRAARMALPVILATGILPTEALERNPGLQFAATLEKPFAIEMLLDTVKRVLHGAAGRGADQVDAILEERAT